MIIMNEKGEIGIDCDGFINKHDLDDYIPKAYSKEFSYLCDVNRCMYAIYDVMKPHSEDVIERFFAGTYGKIHKNTQAAIILAARGLTDQTKIMIRSTLDKLMIMQAVSNDNYNYNKWLEAQENLIAQKVNGMRRGDKGLENLKNSIPEDKEFSKGKYVSQKAWAQMADMESDYNTVYGLFSGNVHCSIGAFEDDFDFENGKPVVMNIMPLTDSIGVLLLTAAAYALSAISIVIKHFELDNTEFKRLDDYFDRFQDDVNAS